MKTIAVIEDNPDNRLLLQALLSERYRIVEYPAGPEALAGMLAQPPDLVLVDVSLPGMDGTAVLARMRGEERLARLPVIALTAHAMRGDRGRFLGLGFDGYVAKPITDENVLFDAIASLIERR